jgi:hypothetical protein
MSKDNGDTVGQTATAKAESVDVEPLSKSSSLTSLLEVLMELSPGKQDLSS